MKAPTTDEVEDFTATTRQMISDLGELFRAFGVKHATIKMDVYPEDPTNVHIDLAFASEIDVEVVEPSDGG